MITRAISIRQPWVEQILRGLKKNEYRNVPTNIRERVYLYASLKPDGSARDWHRVKSKPGRLPTGRIVGTVEVTGCAWDERRGGYAYALARPKRLKSPRVASNTSLNRFGGGHAFGDWDDEAAKLRRHRRLRRGAS